MTERELIIKFLKDNMKVELDIEKLEFRYNKYDMYYRIYKYIKELEDSKINKAIEYIDRTQMGEGYKKMLLEILKGD